MNKSFLKIISLTLIIGINWSAISLIAGTDACFNDIETSENNIFTAGILDFELNAANDFSPEIALGIYSSKTISVNDNSKMDYNYKVSVMNVSGNLCDYLLLKENISGAPEQPLNSFESYEILFSDKQPPDWTFTASLQTSTADFGWENESCDFDIVYEGWQDNIAFGTGGFSDIEKISNTITAGETETHLLITKVYYDVCGGGTCGKDKGDEGDNEWVEIYNPTNSTEDISGWNICDGNSCDTILSSFCDSSCSIPPGGFAVITNNSSTWDYWNIPDDVIKIELNSNIGNGLSNVSDLVILKNANGGIVDQMNWGIPNANWANYNYSLWNPGISGAVEGDILGRSPNGYDTDQVSDWRVFKLPDVTVIIPNGGEEWYFGGDYDIEWSALNNNGDDMDLSIDIYFSNDSGATWANIVTGEENDGIYRWDNIPYYLDDGYGGYYSLMSSSARIKVVATDYTKNFMLSDWDMSDGDFCPPIDCDSLTNDEIKFLITIGILEESECEVNNEESVSGSGSSGFGVVGNTDSDNNTNTNTNDDTDDSYDVADISNNKTEDNSGDDDIIIENSFEDTVSDEDSENSDDGADNINDTDIINDGDNDNKEEDNKEEKFEVIDNETSFPFENDGNNDNDVVSDDDIIDSADNFNYETETNNSDDIADEDLDGFDYDIYDDEYADLDTGIDDEGVGDADNGDEEKTDVAEDTTDSTQDRENNSDGDKEKIGKETKTEDVVEDIAGSIQEV